MGSRYQDSPIEAQKSRRGRDGNGRSLRLSVSRVRMDQRWDRECTMDRRPMPQGEKPRSEPEIIPPDHAERQTAQGRPQTRVFIDAHGPERVSVAKLGPLGIILAILTTGILSTVMLILLFGAFLIWMPLVVFFIACAIISGLLRAYFRRAP